VVVISSLDLSRFGDFSDELVTEINDLSDEGRVSLNWSGSSDLGEQVEDVVPWFSLESLLGVLLEVLRNLSHNLVGRLLEERGGLQSLDDDLLSSLDDVLGLVVLRQLFSPFSISEDLSLVDFSDSLFDDGLEGELLISDSDLLISDGDLFVELSGKGGDSGDGSLDLIL
jgi:hypothetical protein